MPMHGEPYWLEDDTEAALEYFEEQSLLCSGCGLPRDETMSKEAQDTYKAQAVRCHACAERDREAKKFTSGPHDDAGLMFRVEPRD